MLQCSLFVIFCRYAIFMANLRTFLTTNMRTFSSKFCAADFLALLSKAFTKKLLRSDERKSLTFLTIKKSDELNNKIRRGSYFPCAISGREDMSDKMLITLSSIYYIVPYRLMSSLLSNFLTS